MWKPNCHCDCGTTGTCILCHGNVNWHKSLQRAVWQYSIQLSVCLRPRNSTSDSVSPKLTCIVKVYSKHIYLSIVKAVCNSYKLEITQYSPTEKWMCKFHIGHTTEYQTAVKQTNKTKDYSHQLCFWVGLLRRPPSFPNWVGKKKAQKNPHCMILFL